MKEKNKKENKLLTEPVNDEKNGYFLNGNCVRSTRKKGVASAFSSRFPMFKTCLNEASLDSNDKTLREREREREKERSQLPWRCCSVILEKT